eukprot:sb/3472003/
MQPHPLEMGLPEHLREWTLTQLTHTHIPRDYTRPSLLGYTPLTAFTATRFFERYNKPVGLGIERHIVCMRDGGRTGIDVVTDPSVESNPDLPSILILPGGGRVSRSVGSLLKAKLFLDAGYPRVVIGNRRGFSRVPLYTQSKTYPLRDTMTRVRCLTGLRTSSRDRSGLWLECV